LNDAEWKHNKTNGQDHYKTGSTEPIDLYCAGRMFQDFALASIIKYAFRSRKELRLESKKSIENLHKIIDYAQKLIAFFGGDNKQ
jgi:hypothetical protein